MSNQIVADDRAAVSIYRSYLGRVQGSSQSPWCQAQATETQVCNGIKAAGSAQITLFGTRIADNFDWGIAAHLRRCGYQEDRFAGQIVFEGSNTVERNNVSGNLIRMGNPGGHLWNRSGVPDGQVCLP